MKAFQISLLLALALASSAFAQLQVTGTGSASNDYRQWCKDTGRVIEAAKNLALEDAKAQCKSDAKQISEWTQTGECKIDEPGDYVLSATFECVETE